MQPINENANTQIIKTNGQTNKQVQKRERKKVLRMNE